MLFCVVVAINAFCYHSGGYCLLPPALSPPHTHIPQKNRRVWGFAWGAEGASPAESHICLQSSHSKTGGLPTSNFLNERLEHSCEELQRLKKAKFSSPKPPRASGKTSGFMKFQQPWSGRARRPGGDRGFRGRMVLARLAWVAVFCWLFLSCLWLLPLHTKLGQNHLAKQQCFLVRLWLGDPPQGGRGGAPFALMW